VADMSEPSPNAVVKVRRQWNDAERIATYPLEALEGVRWDTSSGGVQAPCPQPFLHGYVWCDDALDGELAHSCAHGDGPHRIKVCIVKKNNDPSIFARLVEQAGPKPARA
jgi:hypothetical protein